MSAVLEGARLTSRDVGGEVLADVPVADVQIVRDAMARARAAQVLWGNCPLRERLDVMGAVSDVFVARADEIAGRIAAENGKVRVEALQGEVLAALETLRYYTANAQRLLAPQTLRPRLFPHRRSHVLKIPCGVVAVIAPWNYPLALALWPTIPALIAGNAVLLKPSEKTPASGELIAELFGAGGLPADVLQVVYGAGSTGGAIIEAGPDRVSFTGSVATGRRIAAACGERLIPVTLELGGKDPAIVLEDADLDQAASGLVWGAFANAGQICVSVERVFAVDAIADELTERVVERTRQLRLGPDGDVGSMIDKTQRSLVDEHVRDAVARGARVLTGGRSRDDLPGVPYEPTVLVDVPHDARILNEETFGPVLPLVRVRDTDEAVTLANATEFGLTASIWTRDREQAMRLARRVRAGVVLHNDAIAGATSIETPWGGQGASGMGWTRGERGLLEMVDELHVSEERLHLPRAFYWYPYGRATYDAMLAALPVLFGSSRRARIRALAPLASALLRARRRD